MDIGGMDIVVFARPTSALREFVERYFKSTWPGCVVEKDPLDHDQVFYYRDDEAYRDWDLDGCTPKTADSMVHVIYDDASFTLVCEVAPSKTACMVEELHQNIMANWCFFELTPPSPGKESL